MESAMTSGVPPSHALTSKHHNLEYVRKKMSNLIGKVAVVTGAPKGYWSWYCESTRRSWGIRSCELCEW